MSIQRVCSCLDPIKEFQKFQCNRSSLLKMAYIFGEGALGGTVVGAVAGVILGGIVQVGGALVALGTTEADRRIIDALPGVVTTIFAAASVIGSIVGVVDGALVAARGNVLDQRAMRAYFHAVLHNDIYGRPSTSAQRTELRDSYGSCMPSGMDRFCRRMIEETIRSSTVPTTRNTPPFLHDVLNQIRQLRSLYQDLQDKDCFSLTDHDESHLPLEGDRDLIQQLERECLKLAGQFFTTRNSIDWEMIAQGAEHMERDRLELASSV